MTVRRGFAIRTVDACALLLLAVCGCYADENPVVAAASKPKEPRPARVARQLNALDVGTLNKWLAALEQATAEPTSRFDMGMFLSDFDRLYDRDKLLDKESARLVNRISLVPKAAAEEWEVALTKAIGPTLIPHLKNKAATLVVIVQQDRLFGNNRFDASSGQVLLQRLATIPRPAIKLVAEIAGQDSALQDTDAVLAIAAYDPLFKSDVFRADVWQRLIDSRRKALAAKLAGSPKKQGG